MSGTRIIDLTYSVTDDMVVYPGNERPSFKWLGRVNSEGYNLTRATMVVHTGTHVDAPLHFLAGVTPIDQLPLECFFGPARLFRFVGAPRQCEVTLDEVRSAGFDLREGDIFMLSTGIESLAETRDYNFLYPCPSQELLKWLIGKKIRAYMTDATSIDPYGSPDSPNHHLVLGAGIPIVENLRNLGELPVGRVFVVCALPLKLAGREGAPCRAVAIPDREAL